MGAPLRRPSPQPRRRRLPAGPRARTRNGCGGCSPVQQQGLSPAVAARTAATEDGEASAGPLPPDSLRRALADGLDPPIRRGRRQPRVRPRPRRAHPRHAASGEGRAGATSPTWETAGAPERARSARSTSRRTSSAAACSASPATGARAAARWRCSPARRASFHDLGLICFGLALRARGWRIASLGADTPVDTLAQAAEGTRPALTVLSSFDPSRLEAESTAIRRLAREVSLVLSGPGATEELCNGLHVSGSTAT